MKVLAAWANWCFGEYSLYFVYRSRSSRPVDSAPSVGLLRPSREDLLGSKSSVVSEQTWYLGSESEAFGLADGAGLAAVCFFWHGDRYNRERGFWPLGPRQAKLVQIVVDPAARGKGLATRLIQASAAWMHLQGWEVLYARVWHSNHPSLKAFERAGWERIAFVAEVYPLGSKRKRRIQIPLGSSGQR